jgi:hypothetical protein
MGYLKDEKRIKLIFKRGFPYPWDFHLGSQSDYGGKNYEQYWEAEEEYRDLYPEEDQKSRYQRANKIMESIKMSNVHNDIIRDSLHNELMSDRVEDLIDYVRDSNPKDYAILEKIICKAIVHKMENMGD